MMENKAFSKSQKKNAAGDFISVSPAVVRRLPRYHRYLKKLLHNGVLRISSAELSKIMNVTASQIRQDLNCFGEFGQQGYGYNVKYLDSKIIEILGLEQERNAILIGAGNLGRALACSNVFQISGITLIALFDINPDRIGTSISEIPIFSVNELPAFCSDKKIDIAVLTLPQAEAQNAADTVSELGIRGIWNLTDEELRLPGVVVENVHLSDSLMTLLYQIGTENPPLNV